VDLPALDAPGFRLPEGTEWEFAARGGDPAAPAWNYRYAGSNTQSEAAWNEEAAVLVVQQTGLKLPNTLGLYDMSGNVAEIAVLPTDKTKIFLLGGSVRTTDCILSAAPETNSPNLSSANNDEGFRVAAPYSVGEAP
jgi:hypothetical protein